MIVSSLVLDILVRLSLAAIDGGRAAFFKSASARSLFFSSLYADINIDPNQQRYLLY